MGHREQFKDWQYEYFSGGNGTIHLYTAQHWNIRHIKGQLRNESISEIERHMNHWQRTNERFEFHYIGTYKDGVVYCICDNESDRYKEPPIKDMTDLVLSVLRGEHEEWHTGNIQTAEVWHT